MHRTVERSKISESDSDLYYYLSIDDKTVSKGHDYISILYDVATGIVLKVVEGCIKESVDELCKNILNSYKKNM